VGWIEIHKKIHKLLSILANNQKYICGITVFLDSEVPGADYACNLHQCNAKQILQESNADDCLYAALYLGCCSGWYAEPVLQSVCGLVRQSVQGFHGSKCAGSDD
jgi:hypothetical protein